MPFYPKLREFKTKEQRVPIIEGILKLKQELRAQLPQKKLEQNLLLATWNIREFGKNKKAIRCDECFYYMAEIIAAYDLVAVQEVGDDLTDLTRLLKILGPDWDYIITDVTEGTSGNGERLAYIYDKRKVLFRKIAGEIVLPAVKGANPTQPARSPFIVSFQSGWFKFYIITVHVYYGNASKKSEEYARRVAEIEAVSNFIKARRKKETANFILLGDFNITGTDPDDPTMKALLKAGFRIPEQINNLSERGTNRLKTMPYDQIAYIDQKGFMEFEQEKNSAGIFDYYQYVFTEGDEKRLTPLMGKSKLKYKEWVTYQMSDHLPLWIELKVNFSENYLNKLKDSDYTDD